MFNYHGPWFWGSLLTSTAQFNIVLFHLLIPRAGETSNPRLPTAGAAQLPWLHPLHRRPSDLRK